MYSTKFNVNILTALMQKHQVQHVVVCPGSRNSALVHNFSVCTSFICHPVTDERSAGFVALGLRQQSNSPVAVCVTSGSALLNLLPAVAEATYQQQGIVVISADRPAAWINQLDGQTMPQPNVFGCFVAKSVTLPEPKNEEEHWLCNRLINEAMLVNKETLSSVHINVPISEPLFEYTEKNLPEERIVSFDSFSLATEVTSPATQCIKKSQRLLIVLGQLPYSTVQYLPIHLLSKYAVVLEEQLSSLHPQHSFTDQLLSLANTKDEKYQPDVVVYIGGNTVSKRLRNYLRNLSKSVVQMVVNPQGELQDISCNTLYVIKQPICDVVNFLIDDKLHRNIDVAYLYRWQQLRGALSKLHTSFKPDWSQLFVVKKFEEGVQADDVVHYANSSAIRLASLYAHHYCFCNRGLNGIEGSMSVAVGASLLMSKENKVYCVVGDLSFFYDENALWQQQLSGNLRILLLNNQQGGIFLQLPGLEKSPGFNTNMSAKHKASAAGICKQFNIKYFQAKDEASLENGLKALQSQNSQRPVLLEVFTDATCDAQELKKYYQHITSKI